MSSRRVASSLSVLLSLGLIVAVVYALADQAQQRDTPKALPAVEKTKPDPIQALPKLAATKPVVLPPPPAPEPPPAPKPAPASKPAPKTEVALEREAPRPAAPKPKPASAQKPLPPESVKPPTAPKAKAATPRPRKPKAEPRIAEKPRRLVSREKTKRPSRPARSSDAAAQPKNYQPKDRQPKDDGVAARPETVTATQADVAEGRTLLRLLEYGSGPSVELAWPDAAAHRETLFATLGRCYGMEVALMDRQGRLFIAEGGANRPWNLNLDRFSGFIREPAGQLSKEERRVVERIRTHHRGLASASPVRVFPRAVDARLLGGLRRLLGGGYARAKAIRAHYRIEGRRLLVERIVADGRAVLGTLEVPPIAGGRCRRLAST